MKLNHDNIKPSINYLYKIIIQNNIKFGRSQYLLNRSTSLFVFQTKSNIEFFNIIDLKNTLYKIFLYLKTIYLISQKQNNFLFASTTSAYSEFIKRAAVQTNTLYHIDRWTCGTITRKINHVKENDYLNYIKFKKRKNIFNFCSFFLKYKKTAQNKLITTNNLVGIFVPDIQNNLMIIKEARIENIPLIGVVNSNNFIDVDYPIFGNNTSVFAVSFYSNLIAHWIISHIRFYHEKRPFFAVRPASRKKRRRDLTKLNYFNLFQKRYMYMIYKFQKTIPKELTYNIFVEGLEDSNIYDYKIKLKLQQKIPKIMLYNLWLSSKKIWNWSTRLSLLTQSIHINMTGGISFTNNFFGQFFWLYFRNFLKNTEKRKRYKFPYSFKWTIKRKSRNWKWWKFGKTKLLNDKNSSKIIKKKRWSHKLISGTGLIKVNKNKGKWPVAFKNRWKKQIQSRKAK